MSLKIKAMLVDDEINIVRNLEKIIPWAQMEVEVVGTASNGLKALELAAEKQPDLILSDIRMPMMDGIELLKQLRAAGYEGEFIMLTGFQEFDYARSAIKFGACDYLLKPIDYEELENVIGRLAAQIRERKQHQLKETTKWREISELAYEKVLLDLLMDYTSFPLHRLLDEEDRSWLDQYYAMLLVDLDDYSEIAKQDERERKLVHFAVRNVLQEALRSEVAEYAVLLTREGEWCVLIPLPSMKKGVGAGGVPADLLGQWSQLVQDAVRQYVKLSVSVGVYPAIIPVELLAEAYRKTQRGLQLGLENKQVIWIEPNAASEGSDNSYWNIADGLVSGLTQGDANKIEAGLEELNRTLKELAGQGSMRVEQMLHFLNLHLLREMRAIGLLDSAQEKRVWTKLEKSFGVKCLVECVHLLVQECLQTSAGRRKTPELLMASARDYIHKHLSQDLGLDELAQHLGISCSYFSLLFKQQHQETFLEYLTRERMELAKQMLLSSDKSVTQIGKLVGYAERRYFTKVFHKYEGMTPSEFREQAGGSVKETEEREYGEQAMGTE
ncbi:two-component system, response regulator YesN [Paenibacillus sp. UNCCL117]|uniref:response regulator transcription factor n=1 Tax=unclassified Paenibacillus TaxID=185978 RepID=UPI00088E4FAF|nr:MULTISPECIES: response regulator [unclassified Paenibacillus]SDD71094.1 two-component system, response regulator YesN [Paenibacillus sp. cl123]SFW45471.1 two-component system, response regulator YesN [Paenibacillus sp. UNCCL117]